MLMYHDYICDKLNNKRYAHMVINNNVYFILHTEDIGFIPRHIIELSNVIKVIKPSKKNITNTIVTPSVKRKFDGKCINLKDTEYGNNLNIYKDHELLLYI